MSIDLLTSVSNVRTVLGITDSKEDSALAALVEMVSNLICRDCKRNLLLASSALNPLTEYVSGRDTIKLLLYDGPIQCPIYTGTATAGSATVTGLSGNSYLFANQSVSCAYFPTGTFVVSADGAGSVTLSQAATGSSASAVLFFGCAVWVDDAGYFGAAPGAFAPATMLFEGTDYLIKRDTAGGNECSSSILERLTSTWPGQVRAGRQMLAPYRSDGQGNIKVQFWAGMASVPAELELACIRTIGKVRNSRWWSGIVAGESAEGQSYWLRPFTSEINLGLLADDVAPVVAKYRRLRWGGSR